MANQFTKKSTFSLLKSNPKLTGNVKLVVDSKDNIYIETIDGSIELSRNKYKGKKLDINNSWANDVYGLFTNGNISKSLFYSIQENEQFFSIKNDFSKQYYTNYQQGAYPKISKIYNEQIAYFVPTWFEPNNIPEYFAILKVPEPVSVNTKNMTNSFDIDLEKNIYNTNYFDTVANPTGYSTDESSYFFDTILKNASIHKVYNLGPDSTIGKYLRNYLYDKNFPESSLTINWNTNEISTANGISLAKSGFTKEGFRIFDEAFPVDRTVTAFDEYITSRFEELGIIHPNIINLEFLFDDEENEDYAINRYFGVYFNKEDISKFKLDPVAFYTKKYENLPQNKDILGIDTIDILNNDNIVLENPNGVKLFVDYEGEYELLYSDVKGQNFIPYIYSTDENFFGLNRNTIWGNNEIVLQDTIASTNEFKGFEKDSSGIINAVKTNKEGRSYFEFELNYIPNNFELRLRNVYENSSKFNLNRVFVGDAGLEEGEFIGNKFSLAGTTDIIVNTLSECINSYSNSDEDFNIYTITKENKLIVFTRGTNAYWNKYQFLIYSTDIGFQNGIQVNFGEQLLTLADYNANRTSKGLNQFLDYSAVVSGSSTMFYDTDARIIEGTFRGGNYNSNARVRIKKEDFEYFSTSKFLKTKDWYTPITSICSYLDEPIYYKGRIVDFDNYNDYISINTNDDVFISDGAFIEVYSIGTNKVGLMSIFPIKQFDVDQFRSDYSKPADGNAYKVYESFNSSIGNVGVFGGYIDNPSVGPSGEATYGPGAYFQISSDNIVKLLEFVEVSSERGSIDPSPKPTQPTSPFSTDTHPMGTGFKTLAGIVDEITGDIPYIDNEYNRLNENELAVHSIKGRIIPNTNKWVYDDEGTDVRDNNYRMTTNSAFSYDNFSPSTKNRLPNPKFYTHEWYYLDKYPPYLSVDERVDTFSYFQDSLELGATDGSVLGIQSVSDTDYFTEYFTQYKVEDEENQKVRFFPKRYKYSTFSGGNDTTFAQTFFRGAKLKVKRRVENTTELNFNIGDIPVFPNNEFNDYKFSAVLQPIPIGATAFLPEDSNGKSLSGAPQYQIIENKKFKTITFVIKADIFSADSTYYAPYAYPPSSSSIKRAFLDRVNLYTLQDRIGRDKDKKILYSDISLSGAITPFIENPDDPSAPLIANYKYDSDASLYIINGSINSSNGTVPNFDIQINPRKNGKFSKIEIRTIRGTIVIDEINFVSNNIIFAKKFYLQIGNYIFPFHTINPTYESRYPSPEQCLAQTPIYIGGGYNYYNSIIPDLSFAAIFDKVNNGSPDIQYITINEDGTKETNTLLIEFENPSVNAKADYIKSDKLVFSGLKNNDFKPIGSKLVGMDNTYFTPMFRYNGNYNPKFTNIVYFRETGKDLGPSFDSDIRENINLKNTQFFSTYPNFALYRQLYYNKINEQNPLSVLELSSSSALNPEYWKISEISLDRKDMYIFRSNWDLNYYNRYKLKNSFESLPGYVDSKEVPSFLASTIMNIPDSLSLEKYTEIVDINITRNDNVTVQGILLNTNKLISIITPDIDYLFQKYVNEKFNYRKLDTFEDDKDRYIRENILSRYTLGQIRTYIKYSNKNSGANIIESNMTEQQLIQNGFTLLENINFKKSSLSEFDLEFTLNKPSDKAVTLAFVTKIIVE